LNHLPGQLAPAQPPGCVLDSGRPAIFNTRHPRPAATALRGTAAVARYHPFCSEVTMRPADKVLAGRKSVKVAVVQTPPVYLDREKSVGRACQKIHEAASHGAELIAFTETWLAGYPYWGEGWESKLQNWIPVRVQFYDQALLIPSEDTERLCHAAAKANAHVVIGCNEMDTRRGVHTIYNTLLFIERTGKILGRHRKTVPTFVERAIWGPGDGTDLVSYDTDIGRIGGLICGEHLMPLIRARMIEQGED